MRIASRCSFRHARLCRSGSDDISLPPGIALGLQPQAAVKIEHPFAPRGHWIAVIKQAEGADAPRPLEGAEKNVIGIHWTIAGKIGALPHDRAKRLQRRHAMTT
jgi:hypothetical protein